MDEQITESEFRESIGEMTNDVVERARAMVDEADYGVGFEDAIRTISRHVLLTHDWFDPESESSVSLERLYELSPVDASHETHAYIEMESDEEQREWFLAYGAVRRLVRTNAMDWVTVQ